MGTIYHTNASGPGTSMNALPTFMDSHPPKPKQFVTQDAYDTKLSACRCLRIDRCCAQSMNVGPMYVAILITMLKIRVIAILHGDMVFLSSCQTFTQ